MTVFVRYAPPRINGGEWTDADRAGFEQSVIDQIAAHSPDFKSLILHCETRTPGNRGRRSASPRTIFSRVNSPSTSCCSIAPSGLRPVPRTGAGHVYVRLRYPPRRRRDGRPGANAAREILRDLRLPDVVPGGYADD